MFKILLLLVAISLPNVENLKLYRRSDDLELVETSELENSIRMALIQSSPMKINDKSFNLVYSQLQENIPVARMNADQTTSNIATVSAEYFHDPLSRTAFSIIEFKTNKEQVEREVRGNIQVSNDEELVVEPYENNDEKRGENEMKFSRIYKRSKSEVTRRMDNDYEVAKEFASSVIKRGNAPTDNFAKVEVVVDYPYYLRTQAKLKSKNMGTDDNTVSKYITAYFAQIINLASMVYKQSLANTAQLKLTLIPVEFLILNNPAASPFTTQQKYFSVNPEGKSKDEIGRQFVNTNLVLSDFNKWLQNARYAKAIGNFDVAILFTGTNLYNSGDQLGVALLNGACTTYNSGMLSEDQGEFDSDQTVAHEIAHTFGVKHDPDMGCPNTQNYVMSTEYQVAANSKNHLFFSTCSIQQLVNNIISQNAFTCLATQPQVVNTRAVPIKPGQLVSVIEQCEAKVGPGSKPMPGKDVCQALYCEIKPGSGQYSASSGALEQSSCESGKWCENGVCTANAAAPKGDFAAFSTIAKKNFNDWLASLQGTNNFKFLNNSPTPKCVDADFCALNVPIWLKSQSTVCTDGTVTNGAPIGQQCKNACGIC